MVSVCLPSDALSQHLPSYLGFSYLGLGVSLHSCSSKAQLLLLTLEEGYLLEAAPPDLERGIAPLGPPAPMQPLLLGCGLAPLGRHPWFRMWGSSSWPLLCRRSLALLVAAADLGRGVAPLGQGSALSVPSPVMLSLNLICSRDSGLLFKHATNIPASESWHLLLFFPPTWDPHLTLCFCHSCSKVSGHFQDDSF